MVTAQVQVALLGGRDDIDINIDAGAADKARGGDLRVADLGVADPRCDVIERPVEELEPPECGGVADPGDGLDRGIDLQLIRIAFLIGERTGIGRLHRERLDRVEQIGDLREGAFRCRDDSTGPLAVFDRLLDIRDVGTEPFRDNQTRGVVLASVDP